MCGCLRGLNVILELYKCNYSLTRGRELGAAAGQKQGAGLDKTRWRAGFGPRALCLPPVVYSLVAYEIFHVYAVFLVKQISPQTALEKLDMCQLTVTLGVKNLVNYSLCFSRTRPHF